MLSGAVARLRERVDALERGEVLGQGPVGWLAARLGAGRVDLAWPELESLDHDLDCVGIHSSADAELLRDLGAREGRAARLARGLRRRAAAAVRALEGSVGQAERALLAGRVAPGVVTALERGLVKAARAARVADIFARVAPKGFSLLTRGWRPAAPPQAATLALAEYWLDRARASHEDVVAKRRDLQRAHELLMQLGRVATEDKARAMDARLQVARAREQLAGAWSPRSLPELVAQLRRAGERHRGEVYRALTGLYQRALDAGQEAVAEAAHRAARSMAEEGDALTALAFSLDDDALRAFELAADVGRLVDVEESLGEESTAPEPERPTWRQVPHPTQQMTYALTGSLDQLHHFVLAHPKTLLHDLASQRQLVRTYLEEVPRPKPKKQRRSAVRVYVCDASGSMHGARARFRDAVVLAELNNLRRKATSGAPFDPLYFSFFNDMPAELTRVDSAAQATRQMEKLFRESPARGSTDITLALITAFDSIRQARGVDPQLARATVVLVTDGEDSVELEAVRRARAPVEGISTALSFIALGEENPDLQKLVDEQRASGGRAFYQHFDDAELLALPTAFERIGRTLFPPWLPPESLRWEALLPHLDALEAVAFGRKPPALRNVLMFDAVFPSAEHRGAPAAPPNERHERLLDVLAAVATAAALAPVEDRAQESVLLLEHLLQLYGWPLDVYLEAARRPDERLGRAIDRIRLTCAPLP